ncbi:MAG: polymerase sigma-70 factor, subfamily [Frankiales bacterium]|jgi:RNA polymerase sigma-70 factor (ECF subfamily)|nr:polymerase sigma-70 factor, subfamily [Frankiales bacterium]
MLTSPATASYDRRASHEDDEALRQLYAGHAPAIRAYALRFTTDARADDIVQETFIRAWRHLAKLQSDDRPVRPWLIRVARHLLTDAARSDRCRPVTADGDEFAAIGVDGGLDRVLDQQVLLPALRRLPPGQLLVLLESWLYGASLDLAAQRLGIPPGTARSRLHYALRALRHELSAQDALAS